MPTAKYTPEDLERIQTAYKDGWITNVPAAVPIIESNAHEEVDMLVPCVMSQFSSTKNGDLLLQFLVPNKWDYNVAHIQRALRKKLLLRIEDLPEDLETVEI